MKSRFVGLKRDSKRRFALALACAFASCGSLTFSPALSAGSGGGDPQPWTPKVSVGVRYFVGQAPGFDQAPLLWTTSREHVVNAPDGRHFFFISHHGDLRCDCNRVELAVYSTDTVRRALVTGARDGFEALHTIRREDDPAQRIEMFDAPIRDARWANNYEILFYDAHAEGEKALFRLDIRDGSLKRLTAEEHLYSYQFQYRAGSLVYMAYESEPLAAMVLNYPAQVVEASDLLALYGARRGSISDVEVAVSYQGGPVKVAASYRRPRESASFLIEPRLSPNGQWAVTALPAYESKEGDGVTDSDIVPAEWRRYQGLSGALSRADHARLWRYAIIDMKRGTSHVMLDAPRGPISSAPQGGSDPLLWSADSRHAVLINVMLPPNSQDPQARSTGYLVDYRVSDGQANALEPMVGPCPGDGKIICNVQYVGWLREGQEMLVTHVTQDGKPASGTVYTLTSQGWQPRSVPADIALPAPTPQHRTELAGGLQVELREGANTPPMIVASLGGKELALTKPDPALENVKWSRQQSFFWTDRNGKQITGGLLLPENRKGPLPLVVQISNYQPDHFRPDGASKTAYAAQALVAQGMAVLITPNVTDTYPEIDSYRRPAEYDPSIPPWSELTYTVDMVDAAVAKLAEEGIVDPQKVGLVGMSRNGFRANYLVTHPGDVVPAAAIIADSFSGSYYDYLVTPGATHEIEHFYGGGSFWENKETWLDHAPFFNIDKNNTPVLFTYNSWDYLQQNSGTLEALRGYDLANREAFFIIFPDGAHQLQHPRQRLASLEATVDWMNFWLQGKEDSDPAKHKQYRRWRELKQHRDDRWEKEGSPYENL